MMKKKIAAGLVLITLIAVMIADRRQITTKSQSATNTPKTEERGSFLKPEDQLGGLQNALAGLLFRLKQMQTASSTDQLEETGTMSESRNDSWWLNSGGRLYTTGQMGKTIQGDLDQNDKWYQEYRRYNPVDTDNGQHPQNIFRLVRRGAWDNLSQETYFQINKLNLSASPNRNASNGLFLFNRYQSGDNLYYTGLRVDGAVVIKKKFQGLYYTLAYQPILPALPLKTWIGLRSEITTNPNGTVNIKLYTDLERTGQWTLALKAVDDGVNYGGEAIVQAGFAGIRTDFMDVLFDGYSIRPLI